MPPRAARRDRPAPLPERPAPVQTRLPWWAVALPAAAFAALLGLLSAGPADASAAAPAAETLGRLVAAFGALLQHLL
ncbi:hypothetical protein OG519_06775 [Streptomyces sp. NBC_01190]|nr:hypothetical protein OG519_06775 [Streptomyces sp. NBC_01190]